MQPGEDRTDHVVEAIDGALWDWDTFPDAMRWTPEPPVNPDVIEHDGNRYWIAEPGTEPPTGREFPPGWREVGYIDETDAPLWPAQRQIISDLILTGNAYITPTGRRVDPTDVVVRRSNHAAGAVIDLPAFPRIRGVRPDFTVLGEANLLEQIVFPVGIIREAMDDMARAYNDAMNRVWDESIRPMARSLARAARAAGYVPPADYDPDETPRERALRLTRERNNGPQHNPHRHRGIR